MATRILQTKSYVLSPKVMQWQKTTDLKCYTNAKPVHLKHSIKDATQKFAA